MTNLKIKPTIDPNSWMDEPIKADKWRNLYFFKCGASHLSSKVHPTEERALAGHNESYNSAMKKIEMFGLCNFTSNGKRIGKLWNDYSHAIQIPVKS